MVRLADFVDHVVSARVRNSSAQSLLLQNARRILQIADGHAVSQRGGVRRVDHIWGIGHGELVAERQSIEIRGIVDQLVMRDHSRRIILFPLLA